MLVVIVIYSSSDLTASFDQFRRSAIYVGSLDPKQEIKKLAVGPLGIESLGTRYSPSPEGSVGKLLFLRDGILMVQDFDAGPQELSGEATPLEVEDD